MINYDVVMLNGQRIRISGCGVADALNRNNISISNIYKIIPVIKEK